MIYNTVSKVMNCYTNFKRAKTNKNNVKRNRKGGTKWKDY